MMPTLQQQLLATKSKCFLYFLLIIFDGSDIRLVMSGAAVKITKLAIGVADVGRIGVAVNNPRDGIARYVMLPHSVGNVHQFSGSRIFKEKNTFFG